MKKRAMQRRQNENRVPLGREKSLSLAAVNIRLQPHSPEKYMELFRAVFDLKRPISIRGDEYLIMTACMPLQGEDNYLDGIKGKLARYTKIDKDADWINTRKLKVAENEDKQMISIPDGLQPHFKEFRYIFYPKNHHMFFEVSIEDRKISPRMVEVYLNKIFQASQVVQVFNQVDVTIVPRSETLEAIWRMPTLTNLSFLVRRPNPDFFDQDAERDVLDRMNAQNMQQIHHEYKSVSGMSIKPSDDTMVLGNIASRNGVVIASGKDENGRRISESTQNHPMIETGRYRQNQINVGDYFVSLVEEFKRKIFKK